jgi:hypothetical protein
MDGNITRRRDAQLNFIPAYGYDHQLDVRPNHNSFTAFSTQDQHGDLLLSGVERGAAAVIAPSTVPLGS